MYNFAVVEVVFVLFWVFFFVSELQTAASTNKHALSLSESPVSRGWNSD